MPELKRKEGFTLSPLITMDKSGRDMDPALMSNEGMYIAVHNVSAPFLPSNPLVGPTQWSRNAAGNLTQ